MRIIDIPYLNITGPDCEYDNAAQQRYVRIVAPTSCLEKCPLLKAPCAVLSTSSRIQFQDSHDSSEQNDFACWLFIRQIHRRLFKAIVDEFGPVGGADKHWNKLSAINKFLWTSALDFVFIHSSVYLKLY